MASGSIEFKAGELSVGESRLLKWVGDHFGKGEQYTMASAIEYYGPVSPGSEGFYGVQNRLGHLMTEKLNKGGLAMAVVGIVGMVAGVAAAPVMAAGAAIGVAGLATAGLSDNIAKKLAERRMRAVMETPQPVQQPIQFKP